MSEEFTISKWRESIHRLCRLDEDPLPAPFSTPEVTEEMVAELKKILAIIDSMMPEETTDTILLNDKSRQQRIADDAGVDVTFVVSAVRQYNEVAKAIANAETADDQLFVQLPPGRR